MIHFILKNEVEDTKSHVLRAHGKIRNKKPLNFHLEHNFSNFEKKKMEKITIDCYNIPTIGINIIEFHIKIFSYVGFTII